MKFYSVMTVDIDYKNVFNRPIEINKWPINTKI